MNPAQARAAVPLLIRQGLGESVVFDEQSALQALGPDKQEIGWLLWHLEKVEDLVQRWLERSRQDQG